MSSLMHVITDVDKSVWSKYFNKGYYETVNELVYPQLLCVVGNTSKVYYLQIQRFKKSKADQSPAAKSFKEFDADNFPTSNDGAIALLNIQTELNTNDHDSFKIQLKKIK